MTHPTAEALSAAERAADLSRLRAMIAQLPPDARRRTEVIAQVLRDLLTQDQSDEAVLAFTLVMAEISQ